MQSVTGTAGVTLNYSNNFDMSNILLILAAVLISKLIRLW